MSPLRIASLAQESFDAYHWPNEPERLGAVPTKAELEEFAKAELLDSFKHKKRGVDFFSLDVVKNSGITGVLTAVVRPFKSKVNHFLPQATACTCLCFGKPELHEPEFVHSAQKCCEGFLGPGFSPSTGNSSEMS